MSMSYVCCADTFDVHICTYVFVLVILYLVVSKN